MSITTLVPNLFQCAAIGMALVGKDGRWLHVNRATCSMLGYSESEFSTLRFQDVVSADEFGQARMPVAELMTGEIEYWSGEQRLDHKDHHPVWFSIHMSLIRDNAGEPSCLFAQFHDITAQKEAEEAQEKIFSLPVALHYVAGFDGYFKKLSQSWSDLLGYPLEQLLSAPFLEFIHPDDREHTIQEFRGVLESSNTFLFENRYRHADGSYRWILWTSITSPKDALVYGVALDYTVRKEAEIKMAAIVKDLERVLEELHASNDQIAKLRSGLLKVCAWTKRIYHEGRWISVDEFLSQHLQLNLSHGISDEAAQQYLADLQVRSDQ